MEGSGWTCVLTNSYQSLNMKFDKLTAELHPIPVKDKVWDTIGSYKEAGCRSNDDQRQSHRSHLFQCTMAEWRQLLWAVCTSIATSLCKGHDPATILYDQPRMRDQLLSCIVAGKITTFPQRFSHHRARVNKAETELIPVFCKCRLPDGGIMIQCSQCDEWYHELCIRLPDKYLNSELS